MAYVLVQLAEKHAENAKQHALAESTRAAEADKHAA